MKNSSPGFPFEETSGQRTAIEDVIADLRNISRWIAWSAGM